MSYECDNDNHDIRCQCPGLPAQVTVGLGDLRALLRTLPSFPDNSPEMRLADAVNRLT